MGSAGKAYLTAGMRHIDNISKSSRDATAAGSQSAADKRFETRAARGGRKRGLFKRILGGVTTALMVVAIVVAVALVGVRLVGFDVYTVLSGSMEPTYHTGSVIYVKPCEAEEVQIGDPITFVLNEDLVVATHRVVDIDREEGAFYTKGDANAAADGSPVLFENLIGKPVFSIPYLGYLAAYVQEPPGTYVAVVVCALLLMLTFLPDLFAKEEEEDTAAKKGGRQNRREAGFSIPQGEPKRGADVVASVPFEALSPEQRAYYAQRELERRRALRERESSASSGRPSQPGGSHPPARSRRDLNPR